MNTTEIDEIVNIAVENLRREIDNGVLYNCYIQAGWTQVTLPNNFVLNRSMLKSITTWCDEKCKYSWFQNHFNFCFKEEKDAIMFTLRWL